MIKRPAPLLTTTVGFGLLYLAGAIALGSPPGADQPGHAVAAWFRAHGGNVRGWVWCTSLLAPVFAAYASMVRSRLPAPHRDVFFFGAIAFATETAIQGWIWAGTSWHSSQLSPSLARTLLDVASFWGPVLTGTTVAMLTPVAALAIQGAAVPTWLGGVCALAATEQAVETTTIFGHRGFASPGGPMNAYLGAALVAIALLSLGIVLSRQDTRHDLGDARR